MLKLTSKSNIVTIYTFAPTIRAELRASLASFVELAFLFDTKDAPDALEVVLKCKASHEYKKFLEERIRDIVNEITAISLGYASVDDDKVITITFYSF